MSRNVSNDLPNQPPDQPASYPGIALRPVQREDLDIFFLHQLDPASNYMAAFTAADPEDEEAYFKHWTSIMADGAVTYRTVLYEGQIAGSVVSFEMFGDLDVAYWFGREYWGRGIATAALSAFLGEMTTRPIHARVAKDNLGSLRVLEKCGFTVVGKEIGFANARGQEIEELILRRDHP